MFSTLIDVSTLQAHMNDHWLILDARHDLVDPQAGLRAYQQSHIPSAVFVSGEDTVSGPKTGRNGRHPLPDPIAFKLAMQAIGLQPGRQVVVYDGGPGVFASRVWWMLRWTGHQAVAVLDGGWAQWLAHGAKQETGQGSVAPSVSGIALPNAAAGWAPAMPAVDIDFIQKNLGNDQWYMLDARSAERYRGESEPIDPVAGHIPGAFNRPNTLNLQADGRFKPAGELAREFDALLGEHSAEQVIHQCGSGISACHNLFAMELAGMPGSALYAGSWSEWCADPERPVAKASR